MFEYLKLLLRYCKNNFFAFLFVVIASTLLWGFMPLHVNLYYIALICAACYCIFNFKKINIIGMALIICCFLSLIINDPSPIFKPWERLTLFVIVLITAFPVFTSAKDIKFRLSVFQLSFCFFIFIGVTSIICYMLGINLMLTAWGGVDDNISIDTTGWFSALTRHSMLLSPICAFSIVYLFSLICNPNRPKRNTWIIWLCILSCLCGMLLSASRIAFAAAVVGSLSVAYLTYKKHLNKLLSFLFGVIIILAALFPVYSDFAEHLLEKNEYNMEKGSMFASREDRWDHRIEEWSRHPIFGMGFSTIDTKYTEEYSVNHGIVEPGSGWLAVLSMTGLAGAVCVGYIVLSTLKRLYRRSRDDSQALLLFGLIMVFVIHLCAEGYIYAGGSFLCYMFWLTLGVGYTYARADEEEVKKLKFELL